MDDINAKPFQISMNARKEFLAVMSTPYAVINWDLSIAHAKTDIVGMATNVQVTFFQPDVLNLPVGNLRITFNYSFKLVSGHEG